MDLYYCLLKGYLTWTANRIQWYFLVWAVTMFLTYSTATWATWIWKKTWDHQLCKWNCTDVKFLKLIFNGLLALYKHVFKSVSFLLARIIAWTLYKSLVRITVHQTSVTNLGFQPDREPLNTLTGTLESPLSIQLTCKQFWLPNSVL